MLKPPNRSAFAVALRLAASAALMVLAFLLRQVLSRFGIELPPFLTLMPTLVMIALFGGLLAGLLTTLLGAALVDYFLFPPIGRFRIASPSEAISLTIFFCTGILLSVILDQYRRAQQRLAGFEGRQRLVQTEEQLRQAAESRTLALDAAGLGAWEFHLATRKFLWDVWCSHAFGFDSQQRISYEQVLARIHPQDRDAATRAVKRAMAGKDGGTFRCEFRVVWPDESVRWIASHGRVSFQNRRAIRFIGVSGDITERKLVEQKLQESEARHRDLVEAIPAMVWAADTDGQRVAQNRRWCEYTGQTLEQSRGRGWREVAHPEDLPHVLDCWYRSARTGEDYSLEYRIRRIDGVYRWHRVHARLRRDADGHPVGWFGTSIDIDDQKRAEIRLRRFYDSGLFAILYWKIDGSVVDVNDRFLDMTGYSREDVRAGLVNWARITPPEYQAKDEDARDQIRETGVHQPYEKEFIRKDGSRVWGQFWAAAYSDDRTQGVSLILDIAKRKRTEEKLLESERQFRTLADAIPQLCWMANADGWIFWYNRRWYEYSGTTPEPMEGWGWQSVHDPQQLPAVMDRWKESIATGAPFDMVFPLRGADGAFRPFLTRVMPVRDAEGRVVRWFGTNTDISEQKRIEAELRKSREQLDLALGVANLGEWDRDLRGSNASRSLRHAQIFGYSSTDQEWNFDKFIGHILPQHRAEVIERLKASQNLGTIDFETQIERADGQIRWLWIRSKTLPDDSGKPARVSGVVMDITDRKKTEKALLRSEKLASVGRMAATIAHEINNPLAAVTNLLFLAQHAKNMPEVGLQYVEAADAELKRVAHIVRQSLGFYRESTAPAMVSVNAVLDSAIDLMKAKIREKGAVIERDYRTDIEVTALGGELRQVFSNLLANSLDAIRENGRIKLRISTHRWALDGHGEVRVTVADDGQGIAQASQRHIFEPFFTTKGTVGTGLGLWVSKEIVEKHRGAIQLRSCTVQPHRGTVCSVTLPIDAAIADERKPEPVEAAETGR